MKELLEKISEQASELLKSDIVNDMMLSCKSHEERMEKLAIASVYSLMKLNK